MAGAKSTQGHKSSAINHDSNIPDGTLKHDNSLDTSDTHTLVGEFTTFGSVELQLPNGVPCQCQFQAPNRHIIEASRDKNADISLLKQMTENNTQPGKY